MTRSRTALTALSLVSVLALGACSGSDPEPKLADPTPTEPTAPSATAVSGPVEPTMPAEARGTDAAAAEAFVRFYWEMVNYAQATGDVGGLRTLGADGCVTCERGIDSIEAVYRKGGTIRGGSGTPAGLQTSFLAHTKGPRAVVQFTLTSTNQTVDYPGTSDDQRYVGGNLPYQLLLQSSSAGWRVLFLGKQ